MSANASIARRLLKWYDRHRRDLPWRVARGESPDPYAVLISEAMLQQTQVATVIPYFLRFITKYPTIAALARADEQDVLRLWQGLGYYSRARNLLAAAKVIVAEFGGQIPEQAELLGKLPGVGRYTAGAVASIAFNQRTPILDGNVARVLCRIDKIECDPRRRETIDLLWSRAEELLPRDRSGDFNQAMMELGATVCAPGNPRCLICPLGKSCRAFAAGVQDRIPPRRKTKSTPLFKRWTLCVARGDQWLIEQRPAKGRWASMWQFVTIAPPASRLRAPTAQTIRTTLSIDADLPQRLGQINHALTHRRYEFEVFRCRQTCHGNAAHADRPRKWVRIDELSNYPLPRPQLRIAQLLADANET